MSAFESHAIRLKKMNYFIHVIYKKCLILTKKDTLYSERLESARSVPNHLAAGPRVHVRVRMGRRLHLRFYCNSYIYLLMYLSQFSKNIYSCTTTILLTYIHCCHRASLHHPPNCSQTACVFSLNTSHTCTHRRTCVCMYTRRDDEASLSCGLVTMYTRRDDEASWSCGLVTMMIPLIHPHKVRATNACMHASWLAAHRATCLLVAVTLKRHARPVA
jgi:hypothetical protein